MMMVSFGFRLHTRILGYSSLEGTSLLSRHVVLRPSLALVLGLALVYLTHILLYCFLRMRPYTNNDSAGELSRVT